MKKEIIKFVPEKEIPRIHRATRANSKMTAIFIVISVYLSWIKRKNKMKEEKNKNIFDMGG